MQENTIKPFRSLGVHGPHSGSSELPTFGTAPLHGPHRPAACAGPRRPPGPHFRGWTALHHAAEKGHADVVKVLLAANAAVDAKDEYGRGPRGAEGGELLLGRERSWGALAEVRWALF